MGKKLVLIHTLPPLIDVFNKLAAELLPGTQLMHVLDEPLLEQVKIRGHLAPEDSARLGSHVTMAEQIQAGAVLVTCSTISPCVDDVRPQARIPLSKIDEAMITTAVQLGSRIGVVATVQTTLEPTRCLLETQATQFGKEIETELFLVDGALSALMAGDGTTHDHLVKDTVLDLAQRVEVIILAQASMARVVDVIVEGECHIPVLSSPHLALKQVGQLMDK